MPSRSSTLVTAALLGVVLCGCSSLTGSSDGGAGGAGAAGTSSKGSGADGPELPDSVLDLERVCTDGLGYSGMPAYDRTKKTVHPAMLMDNRGDDWSQFEPPAGDFPLDVNDGTTAFAQDATFHRTAGLADSTWASFRSHNFPTRYIRHSGYVLRIDPVSTASERADATFQVGY